MIYDALIALLIALTLTGTLIPLVTEPRRKDRP